MEWQILSAFTIIVLTTFVVYIKRRLTYWRKKNVYTEPLEFLFGNGKKIFFGKTSFGNEITRVYNAGKARSLPYAGYFIFTRPVFIPVDIKLLGRILVTDFQHFTDHDDPPNEKNDPLTGHLFSLTGTKWRVLRNKLTPLFTSGKLKMMFQTFVDCTVNFPCVLNEAVEKSEALDIKDTFARFTTDIIGSVGFGIECNCLQNPNTVFRVFGKKIAQHSRKFILKMTLFRSLPFVFKALRLKFTESDVEDFFLRIVRETIDYREKNNVERKDFMQLLMKLRHEELKLETLKDTDEANGNILFYKNGLSIEEIAAQAFVFYFAGFETSSTTLTFLMFEIALQTEIQNKLREEINSVLKKHNGNITYEAIQEMTFLDHCIYETLRKYPPLPITFRVCTKEYRVPNSELVIEKGSRVAIPIYGVQHDPEYYPEPEKFDPERFSEENKSTRPPMTFLAFGEGPRFCIGFRMGVLQTKVGLVALLRDYRFTLNSKTLVPMEFKPTEFILNAKSGVWVNVEKV